APLASRHTPSSPPFFFCCPHVHHRDLHSFPTRRSSDLIAGTREKDPNDTLMLDRAYSRKQLAGRLVESLRERLTNVPLAQALDRSEEHTSELQSLTNLVCRLLLAKKKITISLDLYTAPP